MSAIKTSRLCRELLVSFDSVKGDMSSDLFLSFRALGMYLVWDCKEPLSCLLTACGVRKTPKEISKLMTPLGSLTTDAEAALKELAVTNFGINSFGSLVKDLNDRYSKR